MHFVSWMYRVMTQPNGRLNGAGQIVRQIKKDLDWIRDAYLGEHWR
jgi:hypothetical protein